ncbi:MAG: crossover junction endodeoxyribonuclease RuvC [Planctomycetota bacterium]
MRSELEDTLPEDLVPPDSPWPVILGIDPGTRVVGYGAVVAATDGARLLVCGAIRAGSRAPAPQRLAHIGRDVRLLVRRLRPRVVVVEKAFHAVNAQSALRIGEGRGVVLAAAAEGGCSVAEYPPSVAKKAVGGHGGATKDQVRAMVTTILRLERPPEPDDASDALALALAHVHRMRLSDALGR